MSTVSSPQGETNKFKYKRLEHDKIINELMTVLKTNSDGLTEEQRVQLKELLEVKDEVEYEPETVRIGELPIMVKSKKCNISKKALEEDAEHSMSDEEYKEKLREKQEDPLDPGGYFISNGTERVLITVEDLAPNRVLVEKASRYGTDVEVAKVFSQREGYRALTVVEKKKDGT